MSVLKSSGKADSEFVLKLKQFIKHNYELGLSKPMLDYQGYILYMVKLQVFNWRIGGIAGNVIFEKPTIEQLFELMNLKQNKKYAFYAHTLLCESIQNTTSFVIPASLVKSALEAPPKKVKHRNIKTEYEEQVIACIICHLLKYLMLSGQDNLINLSRNDSAGTSVKSLFSITAEVLNKSEKKVAAAYNAVKNKEALCPEFFKSIKMQTDIYLSKSIS